MNKSLILTCLMFCQCEYYSGQSPYGGKFRYYSSNDRGLIPSESVTVTGALASVTNSNARGGRDVSTLESQQATKIEFADGTVISGPVSHSAGLNSIASIIRNIVVPSAVRDIWLEIIGETGETTRSLNE